MYESVHQYIYIACIEYDIQFKSRLTQNTRMTRTEYHPYEVCIALIFNSKTENITPRKCHKYIAYTNMIFSSHD